MKFTLFVLSISFLFFSCKKEDATVPNPFGINYQAYVNANKSNGYIVYQNYGGPNVELAIDTAYIKQLQDASNLQMCYYFVGPDSLKLTLQKLTEENNYHSVAQSGQNKIVCSVFNHDTINMNSSAITLYYQDETDDYRVMLNLYSSDSTGAFNGTLNGILYGTK